MRQLMGYTTGDGIFCPGGSISNMYGMNLARYKMFPEIKSEGNWAAPRLCFFASEQVSLIFSRTFNLPQLNTICFT